LLALLVEVKAVEGKEPGKVGTWHLAELPDLEIRIGGFKADETVKQVQSVVPPTVGDNGQPREWSGGLDVAELPGGAFAFLETIAATKRPIVDSKPVEVEAPAAKPHESNGHGSTDPWLLTATAGATVEERVIAYLAKCDPAISGQGGHDQTFGVICRVGPGFNLAPDVAYRLVSEHYNPRCQPCWSEAELRHKVEDAYKVEMRRGWLVDQPLLVPRAVAPSSPGATSPTPSAGGSTGGVAPNAGGNHAGQQNVTFTLLTTKLSAVKPEPVEYLVEGYIFRGKVNLLAGPAGRGKSTLVYDQIASHTLGKPAFGLNYAVGGPIEVLVFSGEEYFADTIVPRLLAVRADLGMIRSIDGVISSKGNKDGFHFGHLEALRSELKNNPKIGLVLMDPITSLITRMGANQNDEGEVRELLEKLKTLAEETGVTFEAVKNFSKDESRSAAGRVSGSHAYVDVCRANYVVDKDPDNDKRRILSPIKINGPDEPSSFAFRLESLPQAEALALIGDCEHLSPEKRSKLASQLRRPVYEGKTSHTADQLVKKHAEPEKSTARIKAAVEWLRNRLENGPEGSVLVSMQGDFFLGLSKPSKDLPVDERRRKFLARTKWWREQILQKGLGGASRKYQAGFSTAGAWFFTLPGQVWPPSDQAIKAAKEADAEMEGTPSEVDKDADIPF